MIDVVIPRYEFRVWAERADQLAVPIAGLWERWDAMRKTVGDEVYLLTPRAPSVNTKIRNGELDVKTLVARTGVFQQWRPAIKLSFPVSSAALREEFFPLVDIEPPALPATVGGASEFLATLRGDDQVVRVVHVHKERQLFELGACTGESTVVQAGGRELHTLAIESEDLESLRSEHLRLGLRGFENVSYPVALAEATAG